MKKIKSFTIVSILLISLIINYFSSSDSEDKFWLQPFPDRMKESNYPCEVHYILTDDNYNITLFRIQKKFSQIQQKGLTPVLLVPLLTATADVFAINEENLSPALLLANKGFDVWMINNRGTRNSPNFGKYNYSFHEMGTQDLPAAFNHIQNITQSIKINAIGHSQGAMALLVGLSERKISYANQIILWGAGAKVKFASGLVAQFFRSGIVEIGQYFVDHIWDKYQVFYYILKKMRYLSPYIFKWTTDTEECPFNHKMAHVFLSQVMTGTSSKNFVHLAQLSKLDKFQQFDYGNQQKNLQVYGKSYPPEYKLQNIEENIHFFYGGYDILTVQPDIGWLHEQLKNSKSKNVTWNYYEKKGHASLVYDVDCEFMDRIYQILLN